MQTTNAVTELNPRIFQIRGVGGSSHSYVIQGDYMNVMIDSGSDQNFPVLERGLRHIGMKVRDINLVINSHEHCDHIGANRYFQESAMIAAYRLAASKMTTGDYYVTMYKGNDLNELPMRVHLWLENMTRIDLATILAGVSHARPHFRLHFDYRVDERIALLRGQRVCRRHAFLHRRERQHRRLLGLTGAAAQFQFEGALSGSWTSVNDADRRHRSSDRQRADAAGNKEQREGRDFLSECS